MTGETAMHENVKRSKLKYLAWLPAILVAAVIFYFSAQPAERSTEMSDGVTKTLLGAAETLGLMELSPEAVYRGCDFFSVPVRKSAHIMEYVVLLAAVLFGLHQWSEDIRGAKWLKRAFLLTVFYACTDEFHQLFVPGRAGLISDVMIDSIGVSVVTWILWRRVKRREDK